MQSTKSSDIYWNVDFTNVPDGWVVENYLVKTTSSPPPPPVPTLTLSATPATITTGASSTLSWYSTDTTSCNASDTWSGAQTTSGSLVVTPTTTSTYTLDCTGAGGTTTKNASVNISATAGPVTLPTLPSIFQVPMPTQTGKVWSIEAGDSTGFQNALNQAVLGDTIELVAGSTYTGAFTFPNKTSGSGWIVVRSSKHASLPASGLRVNPSDAGNMPKIVSPGANAIPVKFAQGSHHYRLIGLEITLPTTTTYVQNTLVSISPNSGNIANLPNNITLDRMYIHANATNELQRCVHADGAYVAIIDSYLSECHAKGYDSQAIGMWNTNGPLKFVNNHLEGAGENLLFGGADPLIIGAIPSDVEVVNNYIYTPVAWKGTLNKGVGQSLWTKKNLLETKSVRRLLIEGNVFDGSWGDGQVGHAFVIKSSNQGGACTWCQTADVTIKYNIVKNVGGTGGASGTSGSNNNTLGGLTSRVLFEHNLFQNVNVSPYDGVARLIELYNNAQDVTYRNNTWDTTGYIQHFISGGSTPTATNFTYQDNIAPFGYYGIVPGYSEATLASAVRGYFNYSGNVVYDYLNRWVQAKYPNTVHAGTYSNALSVGKGANINAVLSATATAVTGGR